MLEESRGVFLRGRSAEELGKTSSSTSPRPPPGSPGVGFQDAVRLSSYSSTLSDLSRMQTCHESQTFRRYLRARGGWREHVASEILLITLRCNGRRNRLTNARKLLLGTAGNDSRVISASRGPPRTWWRLGQTDAKVPRHLPARESPTQMAATPSASQSVRCHRNAISRRLGCSRRGGALRVKERTRDVSQADFDRSCPSSAASDQHWRGGPLAPRHPRLLRNPAGPVIGAIFVVRGPRRGTSCPPGALIEFAAPAGLAAAARHGGPALGKRGAHARATPRISLGGIRGNCWVSVHHALSLSL